MVVGEGEDHRQATLQRLHVVPLIQLLRSLRHGHLPFWFFRPAPVPRHERTPRRATRRAAAPGGPVIPRTGGQWTSAWPTVPFPPRPPVAAQGAGATGTRPVVCWWRPP